MCYKQLTLANMKTNKEEIKRREARNFFKKAIEDKRAINNCIRNGENLDKLAKDRGITFATPV